MNNFIVCKADYLPATVEKVLVSETAGFYWAKVDLMLAAQPKRSIQIPGNCPMVPTACTPNDQMAVLDDSRGWSLAATLWQ